MGWLAPLHGELVGIDTAPLIDALVTSPNAQGATSDWTQYPIVRPNSPYSFAQGHLSYVV